MRRPSNLGLKVGGGTKKGGSWMSQASLEESQAASVFADHIEVAASAWRLHQGTVAAEGAVWDDGLREPYRAPHAVQCGERAESFQAPQRYYGSAGSGVIAPKH